MAQWPDRKPANDSGDQRPLPPGRLDGSDPLMVTDEEDEADTQSKEESRDWHTAMLARFPA
jgi:hypothetical protein